MIDIAVKLYKEFNPGKSIKSPRAKTLKRADTDDYGVRWFKKDRFKDILALIEIDKQDELFVNMLPKTPSKMKYFRDVFNSSTNHGKDQYYVFGLTNLYNEIIGWVQYSLDENVSKLRKIVNIERKALVFEVSYAKSFKPSLKGVGVSGLKNTMEILRKIDNNDKRDLYVTAYTDSNNIASEYVLSKNRFEKLETKIMYEGELNNAWIKKIN